ncbi:hypothetical protein AM228_11620 [Planktothricoides sp. SR001]|uniref:CHAT domain-containing protein n=1 Tax=Planktothricoides sp. SR001 TaxID=1705388 RepID=UPI0006C2902F|nr:CHAT domain-containing protein [Planktothricoides sp. SR001]KOR36602.1 hypothetical protein AM228_11620 [Planktothricoides sp. SR001]
MSQSEMPCLSIVIAPLKESLGQGSLTPTQDIPIRTGGTNHPGSHFAIWVVKAPYPGGYVHHDCLWSDSLNKRWQAWQQMFSPNPPAFGSEIAVFPNQIGESISYSSRLMLELGTNLWEFIFKDAIESTFAQSLGIAIGKQQPLRVQLDIRDPNLIALPWEIGQPKAGKPAISLNPQLRFSRTTSDVDPLSNVTSSHHLNILLVLGSDAEPEKPNIPLQLAKEADALRKILQQPIVSQKEGDRHLPMPTVPSYVHTLIQPTKAELIQQLETGKYNIIFYAGHGVKAPDGGQLLLRPNTTLSGTELAQLLVANGVVLAVFNTCWGAQPFIRENQQAIPRSSLAEVLIHHGLPAVLAMRDEITDEEALSFIQAFAAGLANRMAIDRAVAIARQKLLTLYKFNQPAWSLPVLYMHPDFNGELIQSLESLITQLPDNSTTALSFSAPVASLRPVEDYSQQFSPEQVWHIQGGRLTVGRRSENDLVIQERWVSQQHAEIFYRDISGQENQEPAYFLRDFSRYGTLILAPQGWQKIHHQEVPLKSGDQIKFGSSQGLTLKFVIEGQ